VADKPDDSIDKPGAPEIQGINQSGESFAHYTRPKKTASPVKLKFLSAAALVVLSVAAGFAGGWMGADRSNGDMESVKEQRVILKSQGELISSIANEVGESVVSVEVTSTVFPADSFFGFQGTTEQQSAGTGIIIDEDGLIITNRHVVPTGASKVSVTMSDGTKFEDVEVIGRTRSSDPLDIAFLKIKDTNGKKLKAATLADSSAMKVGESVIAIGNALGQFQNTVTSGIISGFGRSIQAADDNGQNAENLENLFQTDAAINQGNSGGPLVNLEGEVIGINTAVAGYAENIGFAIPINDVKSLIKSVSEKGKLERPFLGVVYIPITADLAKQYDLSRSQGVYVPPSVMVGQDAVIDGGPADKAGIKENDILVKINDESIDEKHSITSLLGKYNVDDTVKVTFVRDGKERVVEVKLVAAPEE
jgi:serine protease Do